MDGAGAESGLDSQLWHACAGGMVQLPGAGAKVIYFPQGHGEQAASSVELPRSLGPGGSVPCRVTSLHFLADADTDEVYARMRLQPEAEAGQAAMADGEGDSAAGVGSEKPASFAKTLTQSDANNGGGFSVPRYCAETIFPPLDYSVDPPVQTVLAKDVHGETWRFRHIYRGTPRRHLLTTGWSSFVNHKKLVAGDAIVFLRSATGELCVGVRRSMRGNGAPGDASAWHSSAPRSSPGARWEAKPGDGGFGDQTFPGESNGRAGAMASSFARNRARVTAMSVVEAASLAVAGEPFEVLYYPRASTAEFCVKAHSVKAALDRAWFAGMRFKMAFETEDSSRISWFLGTVAAVQPADPSWPKSPWRLLQVGWDEPDLLQGVSRVSPWQVELVSTLPMQLPPFALPKKNPRNCKYPLQGMHMAGLGPLAPGCVVEDVSAGMQEARQELFDGQQVLSALCVKKRPVPPPVPAGMLQDRGGVQNHGLPLYASGGSPLQHQDWSGSFRNSVALQAGTPVTNGSKTAPFLLFGQAIDLADKTASSCARQHHSVAAGAGPGQVHGFTANSGQVRGSYASKYEAEYLHRLYSHAAATGGPKWFKEQGMVALEHKADRFFIGSFSHCKVFKDSEEVGRTVDLAIFSNYDELFGRLANMFCMDKVELQKNLVYRNSEGSTLQVGNEPYRSFMQSVRRLTILPDAASCGS